MLIPNTSEREILNVWKYDAMNRVEKLTEGVGQQETKVTHFGYDTRGNLNKIIKPDRVEIHMNYDPLGRLIEKYSLDQSVHYTYDYNANNQLFKVTDLIRNKATLLNYDSNYNLSEERLANELSLKYESDRLGRVVKITYPDESYAVYAYQGTRYKTINRFDAKGQKIYAHDYQEYDRIGNVVRAKLAGQCGQIHYAYDLLNRPTSIQAPNWKETVSTYDGAGNLLEKTLEDAKGPITCTYGYDDLYQLKSEEGIATNKICNDSLYNHVEKNQRKCSYNDLNMLKTDGERVYKYDLNGNLKTMTHKGETTHYAYDGLDRLISFTTDNRHRSCYEYDFCDRR